MATDDLAARVERVRLIVYRTFAETGRAPRRDDIAGELGVDLSAVDSAMEGLAAARLVVLDDTGEIVMAHPFAQANFGFSVLGARTLYWGGCAWDSFAIPHLVPHEPRVVVATTCPTCDRALAWVVETTRPPEGDELVRFAVPAARAWDDVIATCQNQRIFCSLSCIEQWAGGRDEPVGTVFDLATLWRLSKDWYRGRLDPDYRRREPAEAADYFRQVGVPSTFWS